MKYTINQIATALRKHGGLVTMTAKSLGITPSAIHQRIKNHKLLQEVIVETEDTHLDQAERALWDNIDGHDNTAIIFYLKYKGSKRGYRVGEDIAGSTDDINDALRAIGERLPA